MNRSAEDGEWSSPHSGGEGTGVPPRRTKVCAGDTVGKSVSDPGRPGIVHREGMAGIVRHSQTKGRETGLALRLAHIPTEVAGGVSFRAHEGETGVVMRNSGHHDMCGRPLRSKRNLQERCGPWSGADMCAAFDAAHTPQARMGVRGSGPIQAHALEALVAKLVFPIRSLDRCAIPLL